MSYVTVGSENGADIEVYYEDHGAGQPVVLIHGYPLSGQSWERQQAVLLQGGYRVIAYDRRGFGRSSRPSVGYDCDTLAADLRTLIEHLQLTDVSLVGCSTGTAEVVRYLGTYGSSRVSSAALLSALPPVLLRTDDNPDGLEMYVFEDVKAAIRADRHAYLEALLNKLYNVDKLAPARISDQAWQACFIVAAGASPLATYACVDTWRTDLRGDLAKIDVPVLVVHGAEDRILPVATTVRRLSALLGDVRFVQVAGGPHHLAWTHPDEVNEALLTFFAEQR